MRIGIDIAGVGPNARYTGMGEYIYQLVTHLCQSGEHEIFCLGFAGDHLLLPEALVQRIVLPRYPLGKFSALLSHQLALPSRATRLSLDVLHVPAVNVRPSFPAVPWRAPSPLVVTLHDVIPIVYYQRHAPEALPPRLARFYGWNLRLVARAARVITVSHSAKQDIVAHTQIAETRIRVVYNGLHFAAGAMDVAMDVAVHQRAAQRLALPPRYLLFGGSYEPRKNLRNTLAAYKMAVQQGLELPLVLVVERESGHKQKLMEYAASLELGDRLLFLDTLSEAELLHVYTQASLFLFPSFYEGFGFPPLQAMASRVPVIAARTSSLPEILGDAAYYVNPHEPEEIARAIHLLLEDDRLRADLIKAGMEQARRYSWEKCAAETLAVYREAASV